MQGGRKCLWDISQQIQRTVVDHGAKAEGGERHCVTCVVLHNKLRSHWGEQRHHQLQHTTYMMKDENVRNPSKEPKLQRNLLKDYFNNLGALDGQQDQI